MKEEITYDELLYFLDYIQKEREYYSNTISFLNELEYKAIKLIIKKSEEFAEFDPIKEKEKRIKYDIQNFKYERNNIDVKRKFIQKYKRILNFELVKRSKKENIDEENYINELDYNKYHIKELKEIVELISKSYPSSIHELAKDEFNNEEYVRNLSKK